MEFFPSATALRAWLAAHHATADVLHVGFFRVATKRRGLTYAQALDEALCFGWIPRSRRPIGDSRPGG